MHRLLHKVRTRANLYNTHIIGFSNIKISVICIYIRSLKIHDTVVDCSRLMSALFVAKTGWRPFASFPAESPKRVLTHKQSPVYPQRRGRCSTTHSAGGSPEARYARQSGGRFCRPETPLAQEGPRQGGAAAMGCPRSGLTAPRASCILQHPNLKNDEEQEERFKGERKK